MNGACPRHHGIAEGAGVLHAEAVGAVLHELVELDKAAGVEQRRQPLARRHLAAGVLFFGGGRVTVADCLLVLQAMVGDLFGGGLRSAGFFELCRHECQPSAAPMPCVVGLCQRNQGFACETL